MALVLVTALTWQIVLAADDRVSDRPIAPLNVTAPSISSPPSTGPISVDTSPPTTTLRATSTSAEEGWASRSIETAGGTVVLRYRPGEVLYQSATPTLGYQVEVEKKGPPEVKIEFESEDHKVEVHAAWADGDIRVETSEETEDD